MKNRAYWEDVSKHVATALGEVYVSDFKAFRIYTQDWALNRTIEAVEALGTFPHSGVSISDTVKQILARSEIDIGIRWDGIKFLPSGAAELDEALVNQPLGWLRADSKL